MGNTFRTDPDAISLWNAIWKKPIIGSILTHQAGGDKIRVYHSLLHKFCTRYIYSSDIIVREEYSTFLERMNEEYETWAHIPRQGRPRAPCYVVTGQPGIGKTSLILYVLLYRLHHGLPTAWQMNVGHLLFDDNGVTWNETSPALPEGYWGLTDSSNIIHTVCAAFCDSPENPIIQVTSPKSSRWKDFAKHQNAEAYYMDTWSEQEFQALFSLTSHDVAKGLGLSHRFGASPRALLHILNQYKKSEPAGICAERKHERQIDTAVTQLSKNFKSKIVNYGSLDVDDNLSSIIFFVRPLPETLQGEGCITLPSRYIADRFLFALIKAKTEDQIYFFHLMQGHPWARTVVGHMFETAGHAFLTNPTGPSLVAHDSDGTEHVIKPVAEVLPSDLTSLHTLAVSVYWYPRHRNFGGIDSVQIEDQAVFVFRFTIDIQYENPVTGLVKVRDQLHASAKRKPMYLVYAGLRQDHVDRLRVAGEEQLRVAAPDDGTLSWLLDISVLSAVMTLGSNLSDRLMDFVTNLTY